MYRGQVIDEATMVAITADHTPLDKRVTAASGDRLEARREGGRLPAILTARRQWGRRARCARVAPPLARAPRAALSAAARCARGPLSAARRVLEPPSLLDDSLTDHWDTPAPTSLSRGEGNFIFWVHILSFLHGNDIKNKITQVINKTFATKEKFKLQSFGEKYYLNKKYQGMERIQ